jgi:hypothetical protein
MKKIKILNHDNKWVGERAHDFYKELKAVTNNNKTEAIFGAYNTINLLEVLPQFRFIKQILLKDKIIPGYHKIGNIMESDFVKFEVYHKDDHDDNSNLIYIVNDKINVIQIEVL